MSAEEQVKIVGEPKGNQQFGKGLAYQSGTPFSKPVVASCLGVLAVTVIVVVLTGTPGQEGGDSKQKSTFLGVWMPVAPIQLVQIPSLHDRASEKKEEPRKQRTGERAAIRFSGPELLTRPRVANIPPGTMVEATLVSGASDGLVKAALKDPLVANGETVLEGGTILVGTGQSSSDRLLIRFNQAVFRDGSVAKVQGQAVDFSDKIVGLKGSTVGDQALRLAGGIGLNFVGGMSTALQDRDGQGGVAIERPTLKNALLNGAATAALDQSREIMTDLRNTPPKKEVEANSPLYVLFDSAGS